jgi:phytoene dehydrogenase-like protein
MPEKQSVCPALLIQGGASQIAAQFCHSGWKLDPLVRKEAPLYLSEGTSVDLDLAVVGGGLAGLSAAALVARTGRSVVIFEQAGDVGGRAVTQVRQGISFNLGPHALYFLGHAFKLLGELGVSFTGRVPSPGKSCLLTEDGLTPLPHGLASLLRSRLFSLRDKTRLIRFLATLGGLKTFDSNGISLSEWVRSTFGAGNAASFLLALFRVTTYADDADQISAGAALAQLKLALEGNVWYIDGGWQTLIDGLRCGATQAGATIRTGTRVMSVCSGENGLAIGLASGEVVKSRTAIVAVPPKAAVDLLRLAPETSLARWTAGSVPVKAACLDLALDRLERPRNRFALGLDRPFYYSVHSAAAKLAPAGISVLHVMKYLREGTDSHPELIEQELEYLLDRLQPGWRSHTVARRYLPGMTVSHSLPLASEYGLRGRPVVSASGHANVFLAGDWVGPAGMLADASAASARSAAQHALVVLAQTSHAPNREPIHVAR